VVVFDRASELLVLKAPGGEAELRLVALSAVKARGSRLPGHSANG